MVEGRRVRTRLEVSAVPGRQRGGLLRSLCAEHAVDADARDVGVGRRGVPHGPQEAGARRAAAHE